MLTMRGEFLNCRAKTAAKYDAIFHDATGVVLRIDNCFHTSIHHDIDHEALDRWLIEHRMMRFYLPPYDRRKSPWDSPELNMIEIVWKQAKNRWRRFFTRTRDTIDSEIDTLLLAFGSTYQTVSSKHFSDFWCEDTRVEDALCLFMGGMKED
jgi:transposase